MPGRPTGMGRLGVWRGGLFLPATPWARNLRMATARFLIAKCLGHQDLRYAPRYLYLEFQNLADTGDVVSATAPAEADTVDYYEGLAASEDRDFLRVPLEVTPALSVTPGDEALFAAGQGDRLLFAARAAAGEGAHGLEFSSAAGSKVYGLALVAAPADGDRTRDVLFARLNYGAGDQLVVPAEGQVGAEYLVPF